MKLRKVFQAISALDLVDLNGFKKYIHSPYFNVNEHLTAYFDLLEQHLRKGKDIHVLSNEELWAFIYPKKKYENQKMLKLNSDLLSLLEGYFGQGEYEVNISQKANDKLTGARKRNQDKLYGKLIGELERLYKQDYNQSGEYYYKKYQIENNIFDLINDNEKKNTKLEIETSINVEKISDNLDYFYITEKLKLYCTLLSWKKMYKLNIDLDHMENVEQTAMMDKYKDIPSIQLYLSMKNTYTQEDDSHYYSLREIMKQHIHLFPDEEVREIYSTAINYCISKVNKGLFEEELLTLYKEGLDRNVFTFNGDIAPTTFRNIVILASRLKEEVWADNFIESYQHFIDKKLRPNAVYYSKARIEYYKKNYGKTLQLLNLVTFEDVWYNLGAKTMQIACYYELREFDVLDSLLQAFKTYLKREKTLTQDRKSIQLNLIKYTFELIKVNPKDKIKLQKIKAEIDADKNVVSKPWLIEKVDELIEGKVKY